MTLILSSKRFKCTSFSPAVFKFSDFIEKHLLVDLPLVGGEYTWFRDSDNPSMSKIDKSVGISGLGGTFLTFDPKDTPLGGIRPLSSSFGGGRHGEGEKCL